MVLTHKPDFDRTMARMQAWWHCGNIDRCRVHDTAEIARRTGTC